LRETHLCCRGKLKLGKGVQDDYEEAVKRVRKLFEERGSGALREAEVRVRGIDIECDEAKEALSHFMSYWRDVVRPSLVSLACEAVGGNPSIAEPFGRALSLLSGATDVHDDIIDRTMAKEGRKTVPGRFGDDIAMLVGDALIFEGFAELLEGLVQMDISPRRKMEITRTVKELYFEMFDGEVLELGFRGRTDVDPGEYLHVLRKKAADIEAIMRVGGILGGGSREQVSALGKYGRLLGTMVLLRNDLEDMLDHDLLNLRVKNESLPLPILHALSHDDVRDEVLSILGSEKIGKAEANRLLKVVSVAGAVSRLERLFADLKSKAREVVKKTKLGDTLNDILEATAPSRISKL